MTNTMISLYNDMVEITITPMVKTSHIPFTPESNLAAKAKVDSSVLREVLDKNGSTDIGFRAGGSEFVLILSLLSICVTALTPSSTFTIIPSGLLNGDFPILKENPNPPSECFLPNDKKFIPRGISGGVLVISRSEFTLGGDWVSSGNFSCNKKLIPFGG